MEEAEADRLARASANLARHYGVTVTDKQKDALEFAAAVGSIYGKRAMFVYTMRRTAAPAGEPEAGAGQGNGASIPTEAEMPAPVNDAGELALAIVEGRA